MFHVVKPCDRCTITSVNVEANTNEIPTKSFDPYKTLSIFRKHTNDKVYFGVQLVVDFLELFQQKEKLNDQSDPNYIKRRIIPNSLLKNDEELYFR